MGLRDKEKKEETKATRQLVFGTERNKRKKQCVEGQLVLHVQKNYSVKYRVGLKTCNEKCVGNWEIVY
jgi:hypothetical protein